MNEATKFRTRWQRDGKFNQYFKGHGIDIGCGNDPIIPDCDKWDIEQGDAEKMMGVANGTYDWVFSSHCLEHIINPQEALFHWWRIIKPGGYLIFLVPEEDLYEQGVWPSIFNPDHRHTFSISKSASWCPSAVNLVDMVMRLQGHKIISMRIIDEGYDHSKELIQQLARGITTPNYGDQTQDGAEAAIEVVIQKAPYQPPWIDLKFNE